MAGKSKFFRVLVEGNSTDGRVIPRSWIEQIAKNYRQQTYSARVWLEHLRSLLPDNAFRAYGDVVAVKAETIEINGVSRLALFAQIDPTADLVAINKARQKLFTSVEVDPDFAKTGEAYLVGLAVTDSPASLGTEVLAFAAQHPDANPFSSRKQSPNNLFTAAMEVSLEFEEEDPSPTPDNSLLTRIKDLFRRKSSDDATRFADVHAAVEEVAATVVSAEQRTDAAVTTLRSHCTDLSRAIEQLRADAITLSERIDHAAAPDPLRPLATGGSDRIATDC